MRITLATILLSLSIQSIAGGPWLNKKKAGFFQIQSTFPASSYNRLFIENNQEANLKRSVLDYTLQAYLEYGLTDKLNILSTLPYKFVGTTSASNDSLSLNKGRLNGLGNYKLGLKYSLLNKELKIAASIQSNFNTISKNISSGLTTGYNANSIGLYIHLGKGFTDKLYSFIDGGINSMGNNFSEYLELHYELGYQLKPSLWTALTIDVRESFKNGSYKNENLKQTGLYTNNQEYFAYGFKASYELNNKIGFTAATFGAFSGNYVAKVATFSLGIYKKW